MFETLGRKLYADLRDRVRTTIGETLREYKAGLVTAISQELNPREASKAEFHVSDWLDEIIGESITTVAEDVYSDMDAICAAMLEADSDEDEEEEDEEDDEELEEVEDEGGEEEEGEEEGDEEEEEEVEGSCDDCFNEKNASAMVNDLNNLKLKTMAIASRISNAGNPDIAAAIRVAAKRL